MKKIMKLCFLFFAFTPSLAAANENYSQVKCPLNSGQKITKLEIDKVQNAKFKSITRAPNTNAQCLYFSFEGKKGVTYDIVQKSQTLAIALGVRPSGANQNEYILPQKDEEFLSFKAQSDGIYIIRASTAPKSKGDFTIKVIMP